MQAKFKRGDRLRYIGKERRGEPIPGKEYHITGDAKYWREISWTRKSI